LDIGNYLRVDDPFVYLKDLNSFPFNIIAWPTEPFLIPVRKLIPPLGGVDISPIIWVGICTLLREILLGQQGLITMVLK
jgi:YggT family protein